VIFEFDDFEIDGAMFELRSRGRRLEIQPKAFELLLLLVQNRTRMVATEELFANLWPSETVGHTSLAKAVHGARRALLKGGLRYKAIQTVWGRGYHFAAPVCERENVVPIKARTDSSGGRLPAPAVEVALPFLEPAAEDTRPAARSPAVRAKDGVAIADRGDLFMVLWQAPASIQRVQYMFDEADRFAAGKPGGILALVVVTPSSAPPDYATALEIVARQTKLGPMVRRQSHVALSGGLWLNIVKSALHAMRFSVRGHIGPFTMSSTIADGIVRVLEERGPSTPSEAEMREDLGALFRTLRLESGIDS
jgi:DNA-binding winged helix-turn-helix (wHTH) protein